MKKTMILAAALCASACFTGCGTMRAEEEPIPMENIQVSHVGGKPLAAAVQEAAARRRWMTNAIGEGTIRCTIIQRDWRVVVDVVLLSDDAFSIRPVESNLTVRKYNQWVTNLCREIVARAAR